MCPRGGPNSIANFDGGPWPDLPPLDPPLYKYNVNVPQMHAPIARSTILTLYVCASANQTSTSVEPAPRSIDLQQRSQRSERDDRWKRCRSSVVSLWSAGGQHRPFPLLTMVHQVQLLGVSWMESNPKADWSADVAMWRKGRPLLIGLRLPLKPRIGTEK